MNETPEYERMTLYRVESRELRGGKIVLLPGVPRELFAYCEVRALRQGSGICIRLPDESERELHIGDYFVRIPDVATEEDVAGAPIAIVISEDVTLSDIPIGSEVQLDVEKGTF